MKPKTKSDANNIYLRQLGEHIERLILAKGYNSAYDFWVKKAGDHLSRATLNYILAGETDPKISTLRTLAILLKVPPSEIFDFKATSSSGAASKTRKNASEG